MNIYFYLTLRDLPALEIGKNIEKESTIIFSDIVNYGLCEECVQVINSIENKSPSKVTMKIIQIHL